MVFKNTRSVFVFFEEGDFNRQKLFMSQNVMMGSMRQHQSLVQVGVPRRTGLDSIGLRPAAAMRGINVRAGWQSISDVCPLKPRRWIRLEQG